MYRPRPHRLRLQPNPIIITITLTPDKLSIARQRVVILPPKPDKLSIARQRVVILPPKPDKLNITRRGLTLPPKPGKLNITRQLVVILLPKPGKPALTGNIILPNTNRKQEAIQTIPNLIACPKVAILLRQRRLPLLMAIRQPEQPLHRLLLLPQPPKLLRRWRRQLRQPRLPHQF
jgi:hypothetical protein